MKTFDEMVEEGIAYWKQQECQPYPIQDYVQKEIIMEWIGRNNEAIKALIEGTAAVVSTKDEFFDLKPEGDKLTYELDRGTLSFQRLDKPAKEG